MICAVKGCRKKAVGFQIYYKNAGAVLLGLQEVPERVVCYCLKHLEAHG